MSEKGSKKGPIDSFKARWAGLSVWQRALAWGLLVFGLVTLLVLAFYSTQNSLLAQVVGYMLIPSLPITMIPGIAFGSVLPAGLTWGVLAALWASQHKGLRLLSVLLLIGLSAYSVKLLRDASDLIIDLPL